MAGDFSSADNEIPKARAAFQADFERAAASQDESECLTPEEILSLQTGAELDSVARGHLTHCSLCSALKQAIQVDPLRLQAFQRAVRQTDSVAATDIAGRKGRASSPEWRLPAAAVATMFSLALVIFLPKYASVAPAAQLAAETHTTAAPATLQIPNSGSNDSPKNSNQLQIALSPPSGPPLQFISTAATTVQDVAPQVATAAVLAKSAITLPVNAPLQLTADVKQEASDIVYRWLTSPTSDRASFSDLASVAYRPAEKAYELTLSGGKAIVTVPEGALAEGKTMQAEILHDKDFHQAIAALAAANSAGTQRLKLADGYVMSIDAAKAQRILANP